ncbi:hypothetical protein [Steroidobacter sp.]|uniref:hypothetical protein n=1 Tax=Steroidobacter sp. TaxID=1978227 RepID=UPI001A5CD9F0|nr:hypothetical protein [Steroidobacter sp.]MBL8265545.1 hypothetical protein [Steroidobacter sp.]
MNTPLNRPVNRNDRERQLEQLIDKALRDQPSLRAPASLQDNVMAEIARRAAAPWWHGSFSSWPMLARVLFLVASVGLIKLVLEAGSLVAGGPIDPSVRSAALFAEVSWIPALFSTFGAALRGLPSLWIYGGLTVLATLYLTLFGVSAAAYRTLYATR